MQLSLNTQSPAVAARKVHPVQTTTSLDSCAAFCNRQPGNSHAAGLAMPGTRACSRRHGGKEVVSCVMGCMMRSDRAHDGLGLRGTGVGSTAVSATVQVSLLITVLCALSSLDGKGFITKDNSGRENIFPTSVSVLTHGVYALGLGSAALATVTCLTPLFVCPVLQSKAFYSSPRTEAVASSGLGGQQGKGVKEWCGDWASTPKCSLLPCPCCLHVCRRLVEKHCSTFQADQRRATYHRR